jgi:hypothetical protein
MVTLGKSVGRILKFLKSSGTRRRTYNVSITGKCFCKSPPGIKDGRIEASGRLLKESLHLKRVAGVDI